VLAPLQFVACLASAVLVVRFLASGEGLVLAHGSVIVKTLFLYAIMVTGALWERDVFGQYLFAPAFYWEDVVSMGVIALHTLYLVGLVSGALAPRTLMFVALAAYASYAVNATQFVLKLRAARRAAPAEDGRDAAVAGVAA
jgi:3-vinyl bacteriochlorophyllide hydratase